MERSSSFICRTCKKNYYLGYGSFSSWLDVSYTLDEFEERAKILYEEYNIDGYNWKDIDGKCVPPDPREFYINYNEKKCFIEHLGHDFEYDSDNLDPKIHSYELIVLGVEE